MTEIEARGYIQGKLNCMNKCDVFEREHSEHTDLCDNCEYCYSQGNFGNQKGAFQMAINALEKQIPKKIVRVKLRPTEWGSGFRCPECEAEQTATEFFGYGKADNKITFCGSCGQKLDWSDEE